MEEALEELAKMEAEKPGGKVRGPRSTTDPKARRMKMPCGGFRPAYNLQLLTDTATQIVVGVDLINVGSDKGQMRPMHEQLQKREAARPKSIWPTATSRPTRTSSILSSRERRSTRHPASDPVRRKTRRLPCRRVGRSPEMAATHGRSGRQADLSAPRRFHRIRQRPSPQPRAATLPCSGPAKAKVIGLWHALAHNLMRMFRLSPSLAR